MTTAKDRLIVALDYNHERDAEAMANKLWGTVRYFKIGLPLIASECWYGGYVKPWGGMFFTTRLRQRQKGLFLDLKLLDIPNTVEAAITTVHNFGADFVTVHAYPQAMRAAVRAKQRLPDSKLKLLAVTALTSMDGDDLHEAGYSHETEPVDLVRRRVQQAFEIGMDGVICSPAEVVLARALAPRPFLIVTPGIRTATHVDDQKRSGMPMQAIQDGADYLVVGRPITQAADPAAAAADIIRAIEDASAKPTPTMDRPREAATNPAMAPDTNQVPS